MKKLLLAVAALLLAGAAQAQIWVSMPAAWVRIDGGDPSPGAGGTGNVATDPIWNVAGDLAIGTGSDTATRLAIGANTTVLTSNGTTATWVAPAAAGGAVNLQGSYPGTPDTGNANITGTYGSTHNNIHNTASIFGLSLENNQAALVGQTREYSPGIRFLGAAWDTDGAVSNTNAWQLYGRTLNGNTTSMDMVWAASLSGGAYGTKMYLSSGGDLTLGEAGVSAGTVSFNNATSGQIVVTPPAGALGSRVLTWPITTGTVVADSIANSWADGIKQTFNPDGTNAGINIGAQAGNPSSLTNGDLWVNSLRGGNAYVTQAGVPASIVSSGQNYIRVVDEFLCGVHVPVSTSIGSCIGLSGLGAGTSTGTTTPGPASAIAGHPGLANLTAVAAGSTSNALMASSGTSIVLENGMRQKWILKTPATTLSTTAETFITQWGSVGGGTGTALGTEGVYFYYTDDDTHSCGTCNANWQIAVRAGSVGPPTSTGIVFAVDTWYTLEWWYESGVGVHFYINGTETSGSPINTNLPTVAGTNDMRTFYGKIQKTTSAGALARQVVIDYVEFTMPLPSR